MVNRVLCQHSGLGRRRDKAIRKVSGKRRLGTRGACILISSYGLTSVAVDSAVFIKDVLHFPAISYFKIPEINIFDHVSLKVIPLLYVVICACAYFKKLENNYDLRTWSIYFCTIGCFICFGICMFHPQWLLMMAPFLVISTAINKNYKTFLLLDILLMLFYIMVTIDVWPSWVDAGLFRLGVLSEIYNNRINTILTMREIFSIKDAGLEYTLLSAILLINVIFKHPRYCFKNLEQPITDSLAIIRMRFIIGVSLFVIPAFIFLIRVSR